MSREDNLIDRSDRPNRFFEGLKVPPLWLGGLGAVLLIVFFGGAMMFSEKIDAGQEAVLIDKPLLFGHGGVQSDPVLTGRVYVWPTTEVVIVNKRPQQFSEHFDDLMSRDGVPLDFDAALRLQVLNSVDLVQKYGEKWYENNVEVEFRNRVRQAVRKHGMNETAISTVAIDAIDTEVTTAMEVYFKTADIPVKLIQVTVGKANPPDAIKDQRIQTAQQEQRKMTEDQRRVAEDARLEAEKSRAKADNAYRDALDLSPQQFVAMEGYKVQREVCSREAGGRCTFVFGTNAGVIIPAPVEMVPKNPDVKSPELKKPE